MLVEAGEAVQSSHLRMLACSLIGALAVSASLGCDQRADGLGSNPPITQEDNPRKQVELDVAAIVAGMTRAHGEQAVASLPKWWQDLLTHP